MEANEIADVVLKPVAGTKGWGVLSLGSRAPQGLAWRPLPGGAEIDLAAIWRHCGRYLHHGGGLLEPWLWRKTHLAARVPPRLSPGRGHWQCAVCGRKDQD